MTVTLTPPIEAFIQRQLSPGYKDPDEVARQALLRWMSDDGRGLGRLRAVPLHLPEHTCQAPCQ